MIGMSAVLIAGLVLFSFGFYLILSYAFRSQLSWGWAIVLIPVIYPIYCVLRWTESKVRNGFLISVIGFSLVMTAIYGGALREVQALTEDVSHAHLQSQLKELSTKLPQARPPEKPLPNEAQADAIALPEGENYDPVYGDQNFAYDTLEPLPPKEDERVSISPAQTASYGYKQIDLSKLDAFHGRHVKVTTKQGDTKEGRLIDSSNGSLSLEIPFKNGFAAFEYEFDNIADVLVYDALTP